MKLKKGAASDEMTLNNTSSHNSTQTDIRESKIRELVKERQDQMISIDANFANPAEPAIIETSKTGGPDKRLLEDNNSWRTPLPLSAVEPPLDYPIELLPDTLGNAILEIQKVSQAPLPMVATSAICAVATATQSIIDVRRDAHLSSPTSIYGLTLGDSGERKSTEEKYFTKAIQDFQKALAGKGAALLAEYESQLEIWTAKREGIKQAVRSSQRPKKREVNPDV